MPGHDRDKSLGHLSAAWCEHFYRHGEGDMRGEVMCLDDDFYDFLVDAYALDTSTGRRLYDLVVLSRPKGTAKSELAGAIALFEAHGPCRFAGWAKGGETFTQYDFTYTYLPGEPMGDFIRDPIVRIMATEETQVGNTFANVRANLEDDDVPLAEFLEGNRDFFSGAGGVRLPRGAKIQLSTAGSKSKDGGKETFAIADESHLYTGGLKDMYNTVKRNLRKRKAAQPWYLTTTTMYRDGEQSIAEDQHKMALGIAEGKIKNSARMLFDHREGSEISDLSDEKALRASLMEAYAHRTWIDYDAMVNAASDPTEDPSDLRRYNLNQQAAGATAYVTSQELAAITPIGEDAVKPLAKGDVITLGFDYAPGNYGEGRAKGRKFRVPDATALIACRLSDMSLHKLGIWEADEATALDTGWNPPIHAIEQTVHEAFKVYTVVAMFADPSKVETYLDAWTAKYRNQLKAIASSGRPMYRYMSGSSIGRSTRDIVALYEAIAEKQVLLTGDPTLTRHFLNARRSSVPGGLKLFKRTPDSPEKIDGAVASVLAFAAAREALNKGVATTTKSRGRARRLY
jgi:phage terminase large subunit-like protein